MATEPIKAKVTTGEYVIGAALQRLTARGYGTMDYWAHGIHCCQCHVGAAPCCNCGEPPCSTS